MSAETMIVNLFLIMYQRVLEQSLMIQMSLVIINVMVLCGFDKIISDLRSDFSNIDGGFIV